MHLSQTMPRPARPAAQGAPPPAAPVRDVRQAKAAARDWVAANADRWPGLRAAHLVGGITVMADEEPFPPGKDVDLHLIFAVGSSALAPAPSGPPILEEPFRGLAIEAGLKSVDAYRSAAAVLANPEIACHLTVDSVLFDPTGLLHELQAEVRRDYARRRWVRARLAHERRGLAGALAMLPAVRDRWGASGAVNILGYTTTFATAALWVATLSPPKMGGRLLLHLREVLAAYGRLDLHEELLAVLGLSRIAPPEVERYLPEAIAAFDRAIEIRERSRATPQEAGPFQHKLHRHLRPYLVATCRAMLTQGHHREAMGWLVPYHLASGDVLLAEGAAVDRVAAAARQAELLRALALETDQSRAVAFARVGGLYDRCFQLAEEIVARHPDVEA